MKRISLGLTACLWGSVMLISGLWLWQPGMLQAAGVGFVLGVAATATLMDLVNYCGGGSSA